MRPALRFALAQRPRIPLRPAIPAVSRSALRQRQRRAYSVAEIDGASQPEPSEQNPAPAPSDAEPSSGSVPTPDQARKRDQPTLTDEARTEHRRTDKQRVKKLQEVLSRGRLQDVLSRGKLRVVEAEKQVVQERNRNTNINTNTDITADANANTTADTTAEITTDITTDTTADITTDTTAITADTTAISTDTTAAAPDAAPSREAAASTLFTAAQSPPFKPAQPLLRRIGKCLAFGCDPEQTALAARLVRTIATDWPRIEMANTNAVCHPDAVVHDRIDFERASDVAWYAPSMMWGDFAQPFPRPSIAKKAAMKYIEFITGVPPGDRIALRGSRARQENWFIEAQKKQRHMLRARGRGEAFRLPPLTLNSIEWTRVHCTSDHDNVRMKQNIIAITRLEKFDVVEGIIRFTLRVSVWSVPYNRHLTDADVSIHFQPTHTRERSRFLKLLQEKLPQGAGDEKSLLLDDIRALEMATRKKPGAVEDLGSAAKKPSAEALD
ncbi:hypothetical protein CTRI78_v008283 [Colletotrichum trifolii]|uniref:Uncharacterized protein n=1 Tax=Colletotrichum trifolii TaxID=5466 RepID=A0A4R8QWN0_COLTR|nr:hypothetical protein CTRI78_v008283 [Colletotrichum trifolii]